MMATDERFLSFAKARALGRSFNTTKHSLVGDDSNCADDSNSYCGCSWVVWGECALKIGACTEACVAFGPLCLTCLEAIQGNCQDCACYYICEYEGPGDLAYQVCPTQYLNCTESSV